MTDLEPLNPGPLPLSGGRVDIVEAIGRIGDGLVYAALAEGRPVRLREYAPRWVVRRAGDGTLRRSDPAIAAAWRDAAARFLDQGRRLIRIDHPAVAAIHRADTRAGGDAQQGVFTIGVPVGESLTAALAAGLVLTPQQVMRLAADLADALAMLHASGLTHLDISPDTISIAAGRLELTDFAVDNLAFVPLIGTQSGLVRPGYSPIEHSDAGTSDPPGPPAHVYAASALLFRLITGRDPPPWQRSWRDPAAAALPDLPDYPPTFLTAVRQGLAIEPADRFPNGAAWRNALALPPAERSLQLPPARPAPQQSVEPSPPTGVPARSWLLPLLILVAVLAFAALGYLAYKQRWFMPKPTEVTNVAAPAPPAKAPERPPPPPANEVPLVRLGDTASGRLEQGDRRRSEGQFEDIYAIDVVAGEQLEIRLASPDFDPIVTLTGPGFSEANDDADEDVRDSRLVVTLSRAGRYFIAVSSYDRDESGTYLLDVTRAEGEHPEG
jgi:hypothetical protein